MHACLKPAPSAESGGEIGDQPAHRTVGDLRLPADRLVGQPGGEQPQPAAPGELTLRLAELYRAVVTGAEPRYRHWLTPVG